MADIEFVDGIRAKRAENAPSWALLKQTIERDRFIAWLQTQPETVHIETLVSKKTGKPYAKVDHEEADYQKRYREKELQRAKDAVTPAPAAPQPQEFPEDDIPF